MKKISLLSIALFLCFAVISTKAQKTNMISGSGSVNHVAKFTGSTTIGNSSIYDNGKIGIGTTNPQYKLHVETGSFTNDWTAYFNNQSAYGKGLLIKAVYPGAAPNNSILQLQTVDNLVRLKVQANGKVGINTDNPQANLHVNGSARITNLGGTGTKMVVTNNAGDLSKQTIPINTDEQTLSISGNNLSISGGNSVTLPSGADNLGNHTATQNVKLNGYWLSGDGDNEGVFINSSGTVGINSTSNNYSFSVYGDTHIDGPVGILTSPDATYDLKISYDAIAHKWYEYFKSENFKDMQNIDNAITKINSLNGITYTNNNIKEVGFNASKVEKIFPELIKKSSNGEYGIDYNGFIPYLTEAIKEQQSQINELNNKINRLSKIIESKLTINKSRNTIDSDYLEQNIPNPSKNKTTIGYMLNSTFNTAYITLNDLSGNEIKKYYISNVGSGKVQVDLNVIDSGIYTYSLVIDNTIIDTKKMIVN